MAKAVPEDINALQENFNDFFETALCGFIITNELGKIVRVNRKIIEWVGADAADFTKKKFSDLLSIGGKIYYETHLSPLLKMQGFFDEVVLELNVVEAGKMRVMVNALERRDSNNQSVFTRYMVLKATDRLHYEQYLEKSKQMAEAELEREKESVVLREQLIAVLGHDLRNPLFAINMAVEMLIAAPGMDDLMLLNKIKRSSFRMSELVNNIMDFARTRLGEGMILSRKDTLEPDIQHVVDEISLIFPDREITVLFQLATAVNCDPNRVGQLLSNLLANALIHGDAHSPVHVHASYDLAVFHLSVCNQGNPIPEGLHDQLFAPFTRESSRPSKQGLGLGLYIASEIARAHDGTLRFSSSEKETCFIFELKVPGGC